MPASLRLFYALWPDDATRAALAKLQLLTTGNSTRYENLHITLAFLGQQPAQRAPRLEHILAHLPIAPMTLVLDRVGYFVRKRIAWAGMHNVPDTLIQLQKRLMHDLVQEGIEFYDRTGFRPHVTLARDSDAPPDLPFEPIAWNVTQIALVQSVTLPGGVRYDVLASHCLDEDKSA